jgi:hypothetical protein
MPLQIVEPRNKARQSIQNKQTNRINRLDRVAGPSSFAHVLPLAFSLNIEHCILWYLHDLAPALATSRLARVLARLHLLNQKLEGLLDVLVVSGTGFGPAALELLRECLALLGCDLALLGAQIRLVAYNDDRDPFNGLRVEVS